MIPKIIHYCWFGPNKQPPMVQMCIETWKKHLPEYETMFWNEENSPMDNEFVRMVYAKKKYAFVSDYVRLWALSIYGGIYLDTDMYVVKKFDDLLRSSIFFGYEDEYSQIVSAGIIGAEARSEFIAGLLFEYEKIRQVDDFLDIAIPKVISKYLSSENANRKLKIYNCDAFYSLPFEKRKERNIKKYATENTYAIHLWNYSWMSNWDKILRRLKILKGMLSHGEFSFKRLIKGS